MVTVRTLDKVGRILQEHGPVLGMSVAGIRARYPARQVRRPAVMEALRHFEEHGLVAWGRGRVRWSGPLPPDRRPLGVDPAPLRRDLAHAPQERVRLMAELSSALARPAPR